MRLQVVDKEIRYECTSCAACCRQPWLAEVEPERLQPILDHDWAAKYPQLRERPGVVQATVDNRAANVLNKNNKGECIFLDADNLCIIHKELGYEAKPQICKRFPYFSAPMPDRDHISANFGCHGVQRHEGPDMEQARADILRQVPEGRGPAGGSTDVALLVGQLIDADAAARLCDRWADLFDCGVSLNIWQRYATALRMLVAAVRTDRAALASRLAAPDFGADVDLPPLAALNSPAQASFKARMLLALDLWNDYFPADFVALKRPSLRARMGLVAKVMHVTKLRGTYASRYLPGNVVLHRVCDSSLSRPLPAEATHLLCRWIRARFRQRTFRKDRLSVAAGLTQQIIDTNAVLLYARASAVERGASAPNSDDVRRGLTIVEFAISYQKRAYDKSFKRRAIQMLESPETAWEALRMFLPPAHAEQSSSAAPPAATAVP